MKPFHAPVFIAVLPLLACTSNNLANKRAPTYVVTKHLTEGDKYVIRHGNVQIEAVCKYSTFNIKGDSKTEDAYCLKSLPVGQEIDVKRGEGDWLFANWQVENVEWHMGLSIKKEELSPAK